LEEESLNKAELIVHPVRLRIIEVTQPGPLTSLQIAAKMPDVPQATLYRQIKRLLDGGILRVAEERLVNGIVERLYAIREGSARFTREEFAAISPQDHARYFAIFLGNLSARMGRYLQQESYDTTEEGMTYFQAALPMTDEEARQMRIDLLELVERSAKQPSAARRPRTLAVAFIPEPIKLPEAPLQDASEEETANG
jgi:hypothetical protein